MAANILAGLGNRLIDTSSLTKTFIENIAAKALDPSRWLENARPLRIRHVVMNALQAAGVASVLHSDDVVAQAAAFLGVAVPHAPEYLKISAMELLYGILKDTALDAWSPENRMLVAKALNYAIYYRADSYADYSELTSATLTKYTVDELHEHVRCSAWNLVIQCVLPLLNSKKTLLVDPFYARLVAQINLSDPSFMQSQDKIDKESRTLLLAFQTRVQAAPEGKAKTMLLKNIQNILDYGVCMDNDDALETAIAHAIQSTKLTLKGLFITAAKNLFSTANVLAFSTATAADLAFRTLPNLPTPVRLIGYSLYPELFLGTRKAILAAESAIGVPP
jgi:hypothetical protein